MRRGFVPNTLHQSSAAPRPIYQSPHESRTGIVKHHNAVDVFFNTPILGFPGTAEHYAIAVNNYSERSKESFLHPGAHYSQLAQFFKSSPRAGSLGTASPSPFVHVVVHDWTKTGRKRETYDGETGLQLLVQLAPPANESGRLVFLRGHTSRDWLLQLGAQYRIDPEYFRRHLDFLQPREFHDLPTLPSSSRNIIKLRITTICTREMVLTQEEVETNRRDEIEAAKKHQRQLGVSGTIGESIIRRFSIHEESAFTLEQEVSFCVKRKNGGWVGKRLPDITFKCR
jgi:hypothetical protein